MCSECIVTYIVVRKAQPIKIFIEQIKRNNFGAMFPSEKTEVFL